MIYISLLIPFSNSYSRKLERKSSTFQRFSLFHGIRAVTFPPIFFPILDQVPFFLSPGIDQPVPVPTSSPSIVACLFFYLDGVYIHTQPPDTRGARGNLCCGLQFGCRVSNLVLLTDLRQFVRATEVSRRAGYF